MADSPPKRVLPARERRESFKLQDSSTSAPTPVSPVAKKASPARQPAQQPSQSQPQSQSPPPSQSQSAQQSQIQPQPPAQTPTQTKAPEGEPRVKRKYVRRAPLKSERLGQQRRHSTPLTEEALPATFTSKNPLPTVETKPESPHSAKEYQSIAESAILAASLHRSRVQWLCDGIFDRYWTKPSKKKGAPEIASNNPDQKSMQRLGNCTISIEPHSFDAVVYTVRDPQAPPMQYARHPNQYPPKQQSPLVHQHTPYLGPPMVHPPHMSLPVPPHPPPSQAQPPPSKKIKQEKGFANSPLMTPGANPASSRPSQGGAHPSPTTPAARKNSSGSPAPPKPSADPVIQMLAARAASDPRLKDLMKVVATSKASPAQLKEFQAHIDEFNAVIKRNEAEQARQRQRQPPQTSVQPQLDGGMDQKPPPPSTTPAQTYAPSAAHPATYASNIGPPPHLPIPMHPPTYPAYAPPRPEALVKHIVLELTSPASTSQPASQDRWLFPEFAVLDTPMSGRGLEMVCSFFVERTGSQITKAFRIPAEEEEATLNASKWKAEVEYYQPVTMTVRATQHRTLETIARAAKPLTRVQSYMTEVMKKKNLAPEEYLTLQLPREEKGGGDGHMVDFTDSAVELSADEDDDLKDFYGK